ncbi:ArnT family glycosyltransferase [Pirellulaceae bacterium SH449]
MLPNTSPRFWWIAIAIISVQAVVLWRGSDRLSPNPDEFPHLVAGISYWRTGDAHLYNVNPPLVRLIASLPAVINGARVPVSDEEFGRLKRSEFVLGSQYAREHGQAAFTELIRARRMHLILILPGTLAVILLGHVLVHPNVGIAAGLLWAFNPLTLGYSLQLGVDIPGATMGAWALLASCLVIEKPSWKNTLVAGLTLGLAVATKSTWIVAMAFWPIGFFMIWGLLKWEPPNHRWASFSNSAWYRILASGVVVLLVAWSVLVLAYRGQGLFVQLSDYAFVSRMLVGDSTVHNRFYGHWLGHIPVPLPSALVEGLDQQWRDFDDPKMCYFSGHWQEGGWWWYYLAALAIKLPLGWIGLLVLSCRWVITDARILVLGVFMPLMFFALVSSKTNMNEHVRYLWIILPILAVVGAMGVAMEKNRILRALCWCMTLWVIGAGWLTYPYGIAYANEAVGGSRRISNYLAGSGADWCQGWVAAKEWLEEHREDPYIYFVIEPRWYPLSVVGIHLNDSKEALEQRFREYPEQPVRLLVSSYIRMERERSNRITLAHAQRVDCIAYCIDVYEFPYSERYRTSTSLFVEQTDRRPASSN